MSIQEFKPRQFQQIPTVVKYILIINVALFAIKSFMPHLIDLDKYLDLSPVNSPYFRPHQFITYMFMHADISHIFLNMLGVYMFGSILENIWGSKRFINFYLLCGLGAAFLQVGIYYFNHQAAILLGASGALFGLLVAFAMMFPNTELQLYFIIPVKAKYLVVGYTLYELFNGFFANDNVAHFAHIGGLIVGIIIMLIWKRNKTFFY
jgi:membrane associated rhomboid family serine protease